MTLPARLGAQTLRGVVVERGRVVPVVGAQIVVLDAVTGAAVASVLTNADGRFVVRAPVPGPYRFRADMIGRESGTSPVLELLDGVVTDYWMQLEVRAISLAALRVETRRQCEPRAGSRDVQVVWEEARKALAAEALTRADSHYRYTVVLFEREKDADGRRILREQRKIRSSYAADPFRGLRADELAEDGYYRADGSDHVLFAPNTDVLLSDPFQATHCFWLRRSNDRPNQIGLAFEPVRGRVVADIEGTLWLDESSAELRTLEFKYTRLPSEIAGAGHGGSAQFRRLPSGGWIVESWVIRMPMVAIATDNVLGQRRQRRLVRGVKEDGGEVLSIVARDGSVIERSDRAVLTGTVRDPMQRAPVFGAEVFLVGTSFRAATDSTGRYRISDLPEGSYQVSFRHPQLVEHGVTPRPVAVELASGATTAIDLVMPSTAVSAHELDAADRARVASDRQLGRDWGIQLADGLGERGSRVFGRVTDHGTGQGLAGVRIALLELSQSTVSDDSGSFELRVAATPGEYTLAATLAGYTSERGMVRLRQAGWVEVDLLLARADRARLVGRVVEAESNRPLAAATVALREARRRTTTDPTGVFVLDAPPGEYTIDAALPGYKAFSERIGVRSDRSFEAEVRLARTPAAPSSVHVTERSRWLEMRGFYDRRIRGVTGYYFARADLDVANAIDITQLLEPVPFITVHEIGSRRVIRFSRVGRTDEPAASALPGCEPALYVDGTRHRDPDADLGLEVGHFDIRPILEIEGIEVFRADSTPVRFRNRCGSVLVWTRRTD